MPGVRCADCHGEAMPEVHEMDMLIIGQCLAASAHRLPIERYVQPNALAMFEREAAAMGFRHAAVGALVRSSYHADKQAHKASVT